MSLRFAVSCIAALAIAALPAAANRTTLSADDAFLAAREAARVGDEERLAALAAVLEDHPLASYVEFWRLQARLRSDAPEHVDAAVARFLERHAGTYIADRMRLEWLLALGARGDLATFSRELPQLVWNDDGQLRCYAMLARYTRNEGRRIGELAREARRLLAASRESGGDGCMALTEALLASGHVSPWERLRALVEQNQIATAKRLAASIPKIDAAQLAQAIDRPAAWLAAHGRRLTEAQRELAIIAIVRLARDEPALAARHADALNMDLSPEQRGIVWGRIGHMGALKLAPEAAEWYRRGGEQVGTGDDAARADEVLEWQVRAALRAPGGPDWGMVRSAIERMPAELRRETAWTYWYGRALAAAGRDGDAQAHYRSIAHRFDFYGKLAAEELGLPIALPPRATPPTEQQVAGFAVNAGFDRALKFYELGLRVEGNREWSWQLRGFDDRKLLAAAEYARSRGVYDRMIATSERTRQEHDFAQRFPAPHRETLAHYAQTAGLDETWVYGLIRQESRFIQDARSSAGAQGLMQIMPATARYVARRLGLADHRAARLTDLDVNLQLGTRYLRMVFDDLDGHPALASAAYNAGPSRARAWRAALARPVEGAIFVETIPFNETRDYVKRVMSNTVYYAALFDNRAQSLKERLGVVAPRPAGTTALP
ncbi:MAG: transglycosylase SLT domain-containing protein [Pseudomonadota bacterium]